MGKDNDDFFGGLFDLDGDGKTDSLEQGLAYMMFEDAANESEEESDDEFGELDDPEDCSDYGSGYYHTSSSRSLSNDSSAAAGLDDKKDPAQAEHPSDPFSVYRIEKGFLISFLLGLLFLFIVWVGIFLLITTACSGSKGNGSGIGVRLIFGIGSFIVFYAVWMHPAMMADIKKCRSAKDAWIRSLDEAGAKKRKTKRIVVIAVVIAVIFGILAALIVLKTVKSSRDASVLSEARGLIWSGDYSAARKLLHGYFPYEHEESSALISLCDAHDYYEKGNVYGAYHSLYRLSFDLLGPELKEEASDFFNILKEEKAAYDKAQDEEEARERAEYENKIRTGVPFVGLAENRIGDTSLGKPDPNMRRTVGTYGGKDVIFYRYDYVRNKMIIFSAYCYNGKVVKVEDYRSSPIPTKKPSSSSGSSSSYVYPDPKEFDDPSDFYYWYYDEFVDYEEAEEYYYSHGGR